MHYLHFIDSVHKIIICLYSIIFILVVITLTVNYFSMDNDKNIILSKIDGPCWQWMSD